MVVSQQWWHIPKEGRKEGTRCVLKEHVFEKS
jgi:hypothetical protein